MLSNFDHTKFDQVANQILNHHVLIVKDKTFRICEIEFYYKNKEHNDEYTHCSTEQAMFHTFYFHRYKNGTYKNGTYKGMDLTFGNRSSTGEHLYCGVLIRSIYNVETNEFIEGPCRTVNKILEINGFADVTGFMKDKNSIPLYEKNNYLYFNFKVNNNPDEVFKGMRVGLSDKYLDFQFRDYRYAIMVNRIKKQKKFKKLNLNI